MTRAELRQRVESYLQDKENRRWSDEEINDYLDDTQKEFVRLVRYPHVTAEVSISDGTSKSGTLTVSGKTATITFSTAHGYSNGDAINVAGVSPAEYAGSFLVRVPTTTTLTYKVRTGASVTGASATVIKLGPNFSRPDTIQEIVSANIEGIDLLLLTEGEINSAVFRSTSRSAFMEGVFGTVPNPFTTIKTTYLGSNAEVSWKERTGEISALVSNSLTESTFRIWPLPEGDDQLYIDKDAGSKVFKKIEIRGVPVINAMTSDSASPTIDSYWHESLVWGALYRAYLKESQSRDVQKSDMYRSKFAEYTQMAIQSEGLTSASRSEGRNETRFRLTRVY